MLTRSPECVRYVQIRAWLRQVYDVSKTTVLQITSSITQTYNFNIPFSSYIMHNWISLIMRYASFLALK
jgi:hypothetical protein